MANKGRKHVVSFLEYNIFSKQIVFLTILPLIQLHTQRGWHTLKLQTWREETFGSHSHYWKDNIAMYTEVAVWNMWTAFLWFW